MKHLSSRDRVVGFWKAILREEFMGSQEELEECLDDSGFAKRKSEAL